MVFIRSWKLKEPVLFKHLHDSTSSLFNSSQINDQPKETTCVEGFRVRTRLTSFDIWSKATTHQQDATTQFTICIDSYNKATTSRHYRTGSPSWQRTLDYSSCWGPVPMVKHQKQTIMTRQVGGIHKGFAFEGFLKCLKWSEFAGWTSRKWSRKHSLGVYYNTIWLTTCGLDQFSKTYVCHSYDWLWRYSPNTLNLKAFRVVSFIFWWLPSHPQVGHATKC